MGETYEYFKKNVTFPILTPLALDVSDDDTETENASSVIQDFVLLVCVGVLRPVQQRGHVEPGS